MILDLRFGSILDESVVPLFNELAMDSRVEYNKIITESSLPINHDIDWWAENVSSRNTYACPLFHHICCLRLIEELSKKNVQITSILVDSIEIKKILERDFDFLFANTKLIFKSTIKSKLKDQLSILYYEWFAFIRLLRLVAFKILAKKRTWSEKSYILVDTFITQDYKDEDRWYGDFWKNLDQETKKNIIFVPTVVDQSLLAFVKIINSIKVTERNNILKEEFLRVKDIFDAYLHRGRKRKINIGNSHLGRLDTTALVKECLFKNRDVFSTFEALLTYSFLRNLSVKGIEVRLFIDWFEGHPVDKLWNLSVHRYFQDSKSLAYETFRSFPFYLSTFPTSNEIEAKVVPINFAVQGKACEKLVKEFCPELKVMSVPAFKNHYIWNQNSKENHQSTVLVAFPISIKTSIEILETLVSSCGDLMDVKFVLKVHPAVSLDRMITSMKRELPSNFSFTKEKSFSKLLEKSSLLITEASSVCLESFAMGRPVVMICNRGGLTYDPIPEDIPMNLYRKCRSLNDVAKSVRLFLNLTEDQKEIVSELGKEVRSEYFEPITSSGISKLLKS